MFSSPLAIPIVLFSIIIHEFSHGKVADLLGDPTARLSGRLTLNPIPHIDIFGTIILPVLLYFLGGPIFGWAKPVPINFHNFKNPKRDILLTALAGPASNLILVFFSLFFLKITSGPVSANISFLGSTLVTCYIINLVLGVFNLLPIPPLDGSKILYSLLPMDLAVKYASLEKYGFFILLAFLYLGGSIFTMIISAIHTMIWTILF